MSSTPSRRTTVGAGPFGWCSCVASAVRSKRMPRSRSSHAGAAQPTLLYLSTGALPTNGHLVLDVALELAHAGDQESALQVLSAAAELGGSASATSARWRTITVPPSSTRWGDPRMPRMSARRLARSTGGGASLRGSTTTTRWSPRCTRKTIRRRFASRNAPLRRRRRRDALSLWENAIRAGVDDALLHRNAGLASYNIAHDDDRAIAHYERALELAPEDARLLFERDQLAARVGETDDERVTNSGTLRHR